MSFLYPALLAGLAAISVPIAIHLLNKFRVQTTDWGAMRFLQNSLRKNERRVKIEDLILLILRCLFVAALILAFARPVLKALSTGDGDGSGPVAAVVLLDNSASMMQSNGVETRFSRAKKEIRQWIDQREPHSLAALYLVSNRTEAVIAKPGPDLALLRKMLEIAQPSERGTDLAQGIRLAYQALKSMEGRAREIRVYTDDQTCAWSRLDDIRKLAKDNPEIFLKPVVIGQGGEDNLGIIALRTDGSIPAAKQPCRIHVEVGNYGTKPAEGVRVSLAIDGGTPAGETVIPSIAPGAVQSADMIISFPAPGPRTVTATIPPDALAADNQRTTAMDVASQMNVLIAEGSEADNNLDRDGYFLANALVPFSRDRAARYYLSLKFIRTGQLNASSLANCEAVFISNPGNISVDAAQALRGYVSAGGSLVVFPGPLTDPEKWKQNSAWSGLLPGSLGAVKQVSEESKFLAWQSGDFEHPVTALWNDSAQGSLGSVCFSQYFPLTPKPPEESAAKGVAPAHGPVSVIVRFANGDPSAVEWQYGNGYVVLFNSTATAEWNNFPFHPSFVPFIQRLMGYLNRKNESRLVLSPGESFTWQVPSDWSGREFSVQSPGNGGDPRVAGQILSEGGKTFVRYSNTEQAGAYRVYVGKEPAAAFAVQLDSSESDLRQLDPAQLESLALPPPPGTEAADSRMVVTREFWTPLIWIVLMLAMAESVLAHRFSQAR